MSIAENGFLDADAATWIEKHREDHAHLFNVCEEINRLSQGSLHKLQVHNEDVQEILISLLFIRSLGVYQASILLIERGICAEARILMRNHLEILFKLRAISRDREVAKAYVYEDEVFRKKFINKFKMLSDDVKQSQGNPQLDDLLKTINKNIESKDIVERQTQWYAQRAALEQLYNSAYSYFSGSVHANVRELEGLLKVDETGNIKEVQYGPDRADDLDKLLLTAGEAQCLILEDISRVFTLEIEAAVAALHARLKALFSGK